MDTILKMCSISKYFGTLVANEGINFEVKKGEIHSLLGENGAGKSTLMNVLYGLYQPDKGEIFFEDKKLNLKSSKDAIDLGIGMIHQHFMLVPVHTVLENIIMGMGKEKGLVIKEEKLKEEIERIAAKYGMEISLDTKVSDLSVGEQQRVEIVKALYRGAKLLIMDEPTAVLTPQETEELFTTLRKMADTGMSIILITHKLKEVMFVCDRVTVLRDGRVTKTINTKETNDLELAKFMIGRELSAMEKDSVCCPGGPVLELKNLSYEMEKGIKALENISLKICSGEILGIAGVDGNGQKELAEAIVGLIQGNSGSILLNGEEIKGKSISEIIKRGVGYIPEDRHKRGLILDFSVSENLILKDYYKNPFRKRFFFDFNTINKHADHMIEKYSIKTPCRNSEARKLSGGNQQKIVVAREVDKLPKLLIAVQPTRGVDIGASEFIHQQIIKAKEQGTAVLLISTELSEINLLSDRIAVIYKGSIVGEMDKNDFEESKIGLMMAGAN
ncbi:heme ABC transporter ATP-binding protein [Tissierella sp. P1]|uniref:ABC transporter ATP-binding protein n=1 Tax=Tissierella sp. P1 TaxID=1280483 RepID=UPI000BA19019|nr:ABC transporter ATP-binding protein [Tissierella sp. P1]OZV10880.1 heme ABC transporter ATP-binding protein [Tissierella sp. P1]